MVKTYIVEMTAVAYAAAQVEVKAKNALVARSRALKRAYRHDNVQWYLDQVVSSSNAIVHTVRLKRDGPGFDDPPAAKELG